MKDDTEIRAREIEAEIERTRAEMDATLSAIESRLTPGQLLDQGMDYLRNSGGGEFVSNLGATVRRNPVPVTLAGIGIAWLMAANRRGIRGGAERDEGPADRRQNAGSEAGSTTGMRERASSAMQKASDNMRSAGDTVSRAMGNVRDSASQISGSAMQRARDVRESARSRYDSLIRDQPLALGAVGLALGAVIAATLPRTRAENELAASARGRAQTTDWSAGNEHNPMPDDGARTDDRQSDGSDPARSHSADPRGELERGAPGRGDFQRRNAERDYCPDGDLERDKPPGSGPLGGDAIDRPGIDRPFVSSDPHDEGLRPSPPRSDELPPTGPNFVAHVKEDGRRRTFGL
jgi:ElaB/YqjD/DUF883 family membrane-anchored ribosome-binding protein